MQFPTVFSPIAATATIEAFEGPGPAFRRPSTAEDSKERALSFSSRSPTSINFGRSERRHSGGASLSPMTTAPPPVPEMPGNPNNRIRSSTVVVAHAPRNKPTTPSPHRSYSANQEASMVSPLMSPGHRSYSANPDASMGSPASFFNDRPRAGYTSAAPAPLSLSLSLSGRPGTRSPSPPLPSAAFSSAMPMDDDRDRQDRNHSNPPSRGPSRAASSRTPSRTESARKTLTISGSDKAMFIAASLYEFKLVSPRREAGFPYLNYVQGEIFDVGTSDL